MKRGLVVAGVALMLSALPAAGQGGRNGVCAFSYDNNGYFVHPMFNGNPVYEGRVTFARIKYKGGFVCNAEEGPGWSHDYPITENHLVTIMMNVTSMRPFQRQGRIEAGAHFTWADPELFKYPVAWLSEPGGWEMDDAELKGFKRYVERGGFVVFDDIGWQGRPDLPVLLDRWRMAFPKAELVMLDNTHAIFNTFFKIDLSKISSYCNNSGCYGEGGRNSRPGSGGASYYAIFQDNDPKKRMLAVINNNQDLGEFMQFSDKQFDLVPSNEAYKLTINYFIYALTH